MKFLLIMFILGLSGIISAQTNLQYVDYSDGIIGISDKKLPKKDNKVVEQKKQNIPKDIDEKDAVKLENTSYDISAIQKEMIISKADAEKIWKQHPVPFIRNLMNDNPKLFAFLVELTSNKEVLQNLMSISKNKSKLKTYAFSLVFIFIFSFILSIILPPKEGLFKLILKKLFFMLFFIVVNFLALYLCFKKELFPIIDIFKKIFL